MSDDKTARRVDLPGMGLLSILAGCEVWTVARPGTAHPIAVVFYVPEYRADEVEAMLLPPRGARRTRPGKPDLRIMPSAPRGET